VALLLFYRPGARVAKDMDLDGLGLRGAVDTRGGPAFSTVHRNGPDGGAGGIAVGGPAARCPRLGYYPEEQTWCGCADGAYWVGYETSRRPTPEDLARPEQVDGYPVELLDGQEWLVPVARVFPHGTCLPHRLSLGVHGEVLKELLPEFVAISRRAEEVFDALAESGRYTQDWAEALALASEVLAVNYFGNRWTFSALGLFTEQAINRIRWALVDGPRMTMYGAAVAEEGKKKRSPDSNTSDG